MGWDGMDLDGVLVRCTSTLQGKGVHQATRVLDEGRHDRVHGCGAVPKPGKEGERERAHARTRDTHARTHSSGIQTESDRGRCVRGESPLRIRLAECAAHSLVCNVALLGQIVSGSNHPALDGCTLLGIGVSSLQDKAARCDCQCSQYRHFGN